MGFGILLFIVCFIVLVGYLFKVRTDEVASRIFLHSHRSKVSNYKHARDLRGDSFPIEDLGFVLDLDEPRYATYRTFGAVKEIKNLEIYEFGFVLNGYMVVRHFVGHDVPGEARQEFLSYYNEYIFNSYDADQSEEKKVNIQFYFHIKGEETPVMVLQITHSLDENIFDNSAFKSIEKLDLYMNYYSYCYSPGLKISSDIEKRVAIGKASKEFIETKISATQSEVEEIIILNVSALSKNRKRGSTSDDYGNKDDSKWQSEMEYFICNSINTSNKYQNLAKGGYELSDDFIKALINYEVDSYENSSGSLLFDEYMSPIDYELYCSEILSNCGWDTKITKATGDQGVDVLAKREESILAVQCKLYSSPVGNKAVQEIYSGAEYVGADIAAVVSNAGYTKSAKELASSLGVKLLHHDELNRVV